MPSNMQLLRAVGAVALLSSAASAAPNMENSNGLEKRDPEPNWWPFGRERDQRHRHHHHHQQFNPSEGSNVTNTMGGTVALNAQSLVAASTTYEGEYEACPTVITSFVTVTSGPTVTSWVYANYTSVARNSSVPGVSWVANATSTSSWNSNAIMTGTSIWNGTVSMASSASTISFNSTASFASATSTPTTFISVTSGIAFNASFPTGSLSSLAQTQSPSRSTGSPIAISSLLLSSMSSSSPGTLLTVVSSSSLASSGSVNIVSPIVLPTSVGGSPLPLSANIISPIVIPTATPLSSASQPTSAPSTTLQTSISTIVALLSPPSTVSTTPTTWTSIFVNASPVSVGTNTPPGTTVSATTTVTSTQSSGTPNPAAVHCGVHGFAVGDFFYAEYVEDSTNVPVSLLGCHEFCLLDASTCVSYEYYFEEGLGAPRCNLYLGSVADSLESINTYIPNVWYDLACGIPS